MVLINTRKNLGPESCSFLPPAPGSLALFPVFLIVSSLFPSQVLHFLSEGQPGASH